ncbi:hypothetical protein [Nocardioides sp. L-11A]|uniref:hypothetical protein n=1 Tax=Nocardioides sp. L-11A TaxID=3043848 RepID=UPI00249A791F|nr:hypothetical protein QJ852_09900 [Nocardioides sp. L-11A]
MEGVNFWEWVAMYGLDGIGGGVLGGVIAWLLLRRTINHERGLRAGDREAAEINDLRLQLTEVRERAAHAALWAAVTDRSGTDLPVLADRIAGLYSALLGAQALAEKTAPTLRANLETLGNALAHLPADGSVLEIVSVVSERSVSHSTLWVAQPLAYEAEAGVLNLAELLATAKANAARRAELRAAARRAESRTADPSEHRPS